MPRKVFTAGEVLAAADVQEFLQDQAVMSFAGTAARGSAIGTATAKEGMLTYLADTDTFEFWDGTAYQPFGGAGDFVLAEYLVIAGGGSGGSGRAGVGGCGGGGAGGYRSSVTGENTGRNVTAEPALALVPSTNYTVTVGAGGAGRAANSYLQGATGSNSEFAVVTSLGGGGGGGAEQAGLNGGSGGGAQNSNNTEGLGTARQGFDGGDNAVGNYGSGGGGATEAGDTDGTGEGGDGISSSITGSAVTRAGGGGAGADVVSPIGGAGGGGRGYGNGIQATAGTANTGGGGGGGYGSAFASGAGGSGIVILRYASSYTITVGAGLTGTTATVGDNKVTTITAGTGNVSWT